MRFDVPLSEACELIVDCPHRTAPEADIPFAYAVGTKAIAYGRIDFDKARPVDQATYDRWIIRAPPEEGDIILCREAPVGPVARVPKYPLVCLGQRTVLLKPNRQTVNPSFLMYALLAPTTQRALRKISEGSTVAHLNVAEIRRFALALPPVDEQERIASVLAALDDRIDSNRRLARLLDQLGSTLYERWLLELSDAPKVPIASRIQVVLGGTPSRKEPRYWEAGTVPWVASAKANDFRVLEPTTYITADAVSASATKLLRAGTTIVAITGATMGKVSRLEIEACANQSVVGLPGDSETPDELIFYWLRSMIPELLSRQTGAAQQHVNKRDVGSLLIPAADSAAIARLSQTIRPLLSATGGLLKEALLLSRVRDSLLPKLVSGIIRVPDTTDPGEVMEPLVDEVSR
jgi:type I restriction enzyme, S subunit